MKGRILIWVSFFLFLACGSLQAQVTGKIVGTVKDADNGEALPGANVVVDGTTRGAATDISGYYFILAVPPGNYSLTASMMGYAKLKKTQVRVSAGHTTTLNFELKPVVLDVGTTVTVVAERPIIELDRTSSKHTVDSEEISQLSMVRSVSGIMNLQAGVHPNGNIRGGDVGQSMDVAYYVDGVPVQSNNYFGPKYFKEVNTSAVQEVSVLTGGLNAEFGNVQGGVVNIITKEGGPKFNGRFEYILTPPSQKHWGRDRWDPSLFLYLDGDSVCSRVHWDDPEWVNEKNDRGELIHRKDDYLKTMAHFFEGSFSGPLFPKATFFVSGRTSKGYKYLPGPDRTWSYQGNSKFVYNLNPNIKFTLGGMFRAGTSYNGTTRHWDRNYFSKYMFYSNQAVTDIQTWYRTDMEYLNLTHMLNPKTFYELKISRFADRYDHDKKLNNLSYIPDSLYTGVAVTDQGGFLVTYVDEYRQQTRDVKNYQIKFDLESQVTHNHKVKTGLSFSTNDGSAINFRKFGSDRDIEFYGTLFQPDTSNAFEPDKQIKPWQFSAYIQDKMEFAGMIVNAGIRYDYFDPNTQRPVDPFDLHRAKYETIYNVRKVPTEKAKGISQWSPRLGISHPITERSVLHFFYGLFFQTPSFDRLYMTRFESNDPDQLDRPWGNYDYLEKTNNLRLLPERTASYEVGFQYNFSHDFLLDVSAYYKSAKNQLSWGGWSTYAILKWPELEFYGYPAEEPTASQNFYRAYENALYENARGLEFTLKKMMSRSFSMQIVYSLGYAKKGVSGLRDVYLVPPKLMLPENHNDLVMLLSLFDNTLSDVRPNPYGEGYVWYHNEAGEFQPKGGDDLRSNGNIVLTLSYPMNFGPSILGFRPLSDFGINVIYQFRSGSPIKYTGLDGQEHWRRQALYTYTDLGVRKGFAIGALTFEVFTEISNLFNTKNITVGGESSDKLNYIEYGLYDVRVNEIGTAQREKLGDMYDLYRYLGNRRYYRVGVRLMF